MSLSWGSRWHSFLQNGKHLQTGWIVTAAALAFYLGVIRPQESRISIDNSKSAGLAAVAQHSQLLARSRTKTVGFVGGVARADVDKAALISAHFSEAPPQSAPDSQDADADRKMVRTATIEMLVQSPAYVAEKIRILAERDGGFLVTSEVHGEPDATGATLTVRVPAVRFEAVREQIRKLGLRVENERLEAQDVTRQYADQEANLRNLKAEEQQYLLILKQARTVKDTLEVSEKLSDVRGQIDQQQAEFNALSKQVETVAISISLHAEADTRVLGLNWRPLYQIKVAFRDGLSGLADYFSAIVAFVFFLPTIVLWLATVGLGGVVVWKLFRWMARRWFGWGAFPSSATTPAS
jgi:hypothetical protein